VGARFSAPNWNWVISGSKATGPWRWPLTPTNGEIKGRVKLNLYSPYGPWWSVLGWTVPVQHFFVSWSEIDSRSSRYRKRADLQKQSLKRRYIDVYNRPHFIPSCLFFLSTHLTQNIVSTVKNNHPKHTTWLKVRYFWPSLTKIGKRRTIFVQIPKTKFHKNPSSGTWNVACGRTDRQTDRHT